MTGYDQLQMMAVEVYSTDEVKGVAPTGKSSEISTGQIIHTVITVAVFLGTTVYYGGQLTARLDSATAALHSLEVRVGDAEKAQNQANVAIALLQDEFKLLREDLQKNNNNSGHR